MEQPGANARALFALATVLCAFGIGAPVIAPGELASALMRDLAMASTTLLAVGGTLRLPPERRRAWWFVAGGCFAFFLADVAWDVYLFALKVEAPLPSYADLANSRGVSALRPRRGRTDAPTHARGSRQRRARRRHARSGAEPCRLGTAPARRRAQRARFIRHRRVPGRRHCADRRGRDPRRGRPAADAATLVFLAGPIVLFAADLGYLALRGNGTYESGAWPDPLCSSSDRSCSPLRPGSTNRLPTEEPAAPRRARPVAATMVVVAGAGCAAASTSASPTPSDTQTHETFVRVGLRVALLALVALRLIRQASRNQQLVDELANTTTRSTMVIENTADAVIFTDPAGDVLEWNAAAERLFARSRAEILGRNALAEFVRPEYADALANVDLSTGAFAEISLPMLIDGTTVPVTLQIASVRDASENVLGFVTVARDDTRRLFARYAPARTFARLDPQEAMTHFADELHAFVPFQMLSLRVGRGGQFRELVRIEAQATEHFVAADPAALVTGTLADFGLGGLGDEPFQILAAEQHGDRGDEVRATGAAESISLPLRDPLTRELTGLLALGFGTAGTATAAHAEALARVAPDLSQSVANMMLYEQQRLHAERLQELDDMRDAFLRLVAHELRSPLGAISTAAGVLRDHATSIGEAEARELASGIATDARRLSRLTSDLVDATRVGDGRVPV